MAKIIKKRSFGGTPAVDFLDLSYLMPLVSAATLKDSGEPPLIFGSPLRIGASAAQAAGRLTRGVAYEMFVRSLMSTFHEAIDVRSANVAKWITSQYEGRDYPYVIIGPPIGSLIYLAAVLDAPFLPVNYSLAVKHRQLNPDSMKDHIGYAEKIASSLLKKDDNIEIIHEYNPIHQRFRIKNGSLLRCRFKSLPVAYEKFIKTNLRPKGTVIAVEARVPWRQYKLSKDFYHQVGQLGGIPCEEYLFGSSRLNMFLGRFMQTEAVYKLGQDTDVLPEAKFGVSPGIRIGAIAAADNLGRNALHLYTSDIYLLNHLVSQLFLRCARREGLRPQFCYVHSGNFIAPSVSIKSLMMPIWVPSPCYPALDFVNNYLSKYPFHVDEILLSFEPSIEEAPDFLQLRRWRESLERVAPVKLIGMNPVQYPYQMTSIFNNWPQLNSWAKKHRQPLTIRVSSDIVIEEAEKCGIGFQFYDNA